MGGGTEEGSPYHGPPDVVIQGGNQVREDENVQDMNGSPQAGMVSWAGSNRVAVGIGCGEGDCEYTPAGFARGDLEWRW